MSIMHNHLRKRDMLLAGLRAFLKLHLRGDRPLLVGFSGGLDSTVLLQLLLRAATVPIEIAHLDHGWRRESAQQAHQIKTMAETLGIPCHIKVAAINQRSELAAREERYAFFMELLSGGFYQALLLAHHADDQAETVLKRLFEGASLTGLQSMQPISNYAGWPVWRPLLDLPKAVLKQWALQENLSFFDDYTNRDPKYLRAKMRIELMPYLSVQFGKHVTPALCRIGKYAIKVEHYLARKTEEFPLNIIEGKIATYWDLRPLNHCQPLELEYLLRNFFKQREITLSQPILEAVLEAVAENKLNQSFKVKTATLQLDRQRLFVVRQPLPHFTKNFMEKGWNWQIRHECMQVPLPEGTLAELLDGQLKAALPEGDYQLIPYSERNFFINAACLEEKWRLKQVPSFLRPMIPLVVKGEEIVADFLTRNYYQKDCKFHMAAFLEIKKRD